MNDILLPLAALAALGYFLTRKKPGPSEPLDTPDDTRPGKAVDPWLEPCRQFYQNAVDAECGPGVRFLQYEGGPLISLAGRSCEQIYANYIERRRSCNVYGPQLPPPGEPAGFPMPVGRTT